MDMDMDIAVIIRAIIPITRDITGTAIRDILTRIMGTIAVAAVIIAGKQG